MHIPLSLTNKKKQEHSPCDFPEQYRRGPEETILSRQDYQNVRLIFRGKRFRIYGKKHIFAGGSERKDEA